MTGKHHNFMVQQLALQQSINHTVVDQTIAAPYLFVWGSSSFFSLGHPQKALELLNKGLGITSTATTDHMHSQLLQWQAFGLALTGYSEKAYEKIVQSTQLREQAGGPFYQAFHNIIAGAIYTRLKKFEEARVALQKGLAVAQVIPSTYLTICALFNISFLKLEEEGPDAALEDLESGLSLMKINGYDHFWTWEPTMMKKLLSLAVQRDIEKSFAQALANGRLDLNFSNDGEPLPLLHLSLLDGFKLKMSEKILFRSKDFTPFQRELLGLLITTKGQRIPQDKIQLALWPESSPENARKSIDSLLTRLRKIIAPHLPAEINEYLYLQKGILCLANHQIDALQFIETVRTGLSHSRNSDWWQAQNAFQIALHLWKGAMPEDTFRSEQALNFNDMLAGLLVDAASIWSKNLAISGRLEEAIALIEQVLRINYLEESLTVLLYKFHSQNTNPLKANEILERYRKALLKADYTESEVSFFIDEIIKTTD
jgi:LuxR family maltose regulon positive regulatory protein